MEVKETSLATEDFADTTLENQSKLEFRTLKKCKIIAVYVEHLYSLPNLKYNVYNVNKVTFKSFLQNTLLFLSSYHYKQFSHFGILINRLWYWSFKTVKVIILQLPQWNIMAQTNL